MYARIITITCLLIIGWSSISQADILGTDAQDVLMNRLSELGLNDLVIDLNVRIPVPATAAQPAVDLFGTVIRHGTKNMPTILVATAYRREFCILLYLPLLLHGYNLMGVDIRGTGSSEGQWLAWGPEEHLDIAYTIDQWIPRQVWSDGRVGMIGPSYMGIAQLLAAGQIQTDAAGYPTHLKALMPFVSMSDTYQDIAMQGGNIDLVIIAAWLGATDLLSLLPSLIILGEGSTLTPDLDNLAEVQATWQAHLKSIPIQLGWFLDTANLTKSDYFEVRSPMIYWPQKPLGGWDIPEYDYLNIGTIPSKLPVFHVGGWFDALERGTLNNYQYGLANHAAGDKALVMGPWYHMDGAIGMGINGFLTGEIPARWFDWKIKGIYDPFMVTYPVLLYVDGAKKWRAEKSWPLGADRVESKRYYLSKKSASPIVGDWFAVENADNNYRLVDAPGFDDYNNKFWFITWAKSNPVLAHDPNHLHGLISRSSARWLLGIPPIVSQATKLMLGFDMDPYMPYEDERTDELGVLTFSTEPLAQDLEICGPLLLTFWAKSDFSPAISAEQVQNVHDRVEALFNIDITSLLDLTTAKSVQWVVEVNDVFPGGRARNISSGWLNASQRPYNPANKQTIDPAYIPFDPFYDHSSKYPDPITPGQTYAYAIEVWPMDNVFKAGHRIRVSISASDFPHLLPIVQPSQNTIVIDETHPARLEFKAVKSSSEGANWKWVSNASTYLRTHTN